MANGRPKPRMDYGQYIKTELQAGTKKGAAWSKILFDRVYRMMKTDPAYKDGDTFDYSQMQIDAIKDVSQTNREALAQSGLSIIDLTENDPVWQQKAEEEATQADIAELEQANAATLQALEQQAKPQSTPSQTTATAIKALELEQGHWITLKSGKRVFIRNK